jgi:hypothetical protein
MVLAYLLIGAILWFGIPSISTISMVAAGTMGIGYLSKQREIINLKWQIEDLTRTQVSFSASEREKLEDFQGRSSSKNGLLAIEYGGDDLSIRE